METRERTKVATPTRRFVEETERLQFFAATPELLTALVEDVAAFERALDVVYRGEPLDAEFRRVVASIRTALAANDGADRFWRTLWLIVRRSDRVVVGSFDFKGAPDANGDVEIGYGLGEAFEGCGYMTETVAATTRRAFAEPDGPARIVAETDVANEKSRRVLERCGFERVGGDDSFVRFALRAPSKTR